MKYIVTAENTDYIPKSILNLQSDPTIKILTARNVLDQKLIFNDTDKVYISSDTIYPLIRNNFSEKIKNVIDNFRNKYNFRINLQQNFPHFFFDRINLLELEKYNFNFHSKSKYVLKPCNGFMGAGVRVVTKDTDLSVLFRDIRREVDHYSKMYPNLFSEDFIVEDYIDGEEHAVDMYYNEEGKPVIVNIYGHPAAKRSEYLQMLYYTYHGIFEKYYKYFLDFFLNINEKFKIKNFPIHAEFKQSSEGELIPIEFNSSRFGGMGLIDLAYHAFGFNPIKEYFSDTKLDWHKIWQMHQGKYFCWILGYNAADIEVRNYLPNHDKFKSAFPATTKLLAYEKLNHLCFPAFALVYTETKSRSDLDYMLNLEFNEYFE